MDERQTDILTGIRKLREKAAKQLSGNEYYMVMQQLNTIAGSPELGGDLGQAILGLIRSRLDGGSHRASASGDPEIPSPGDTPAQPESPGSPEAPSIPDSPAQPDISPTPEIPSPPSSPAEPAWPPETQSRTVPGDQEQVVSPRANSFGMPQATGAITMTNIEAHDAETPAKADKTVSPTLLSPVPAQAGSAKMPDAPPQSPLSLAASAARRHIVQHLHGNDYYTAANLLDQLRDLPHSAIEGDPIFPSGDLDAALAFLHEQVGSLQGSIQRDATALMKSLGEIIDPKRKPALERHEASLAVSESVEEPAPAQTDLSSAPDPVSDPGPRTGFDDLAEAAWRRVKDLDEAERTHAPGLNGRAAPEPTIATASSVEESARKPEREAVEAVETEAAAKPLPAEPMSEDKADAFDDGGWERRSSEPCLAGIEPDIPSVAPTAGHEPAYKAEIESWTAARHKAARSSQTEAVAEPETEMGSGAIEMSGDDLEIEKIGPTGSAESTLQDDIRDRMSRRQAEEMTDGPSKKLVEKMEEAIEEASETESSENADRSKREAGDAAFISEDTASEQAEPSPKNTPAPDARRGFLSRLFGLRAAEYR